MNSQPPTLPEIEASIWRGLADATSGTSQWRLPVLSTVAETVPMSRTIVLRAVDQSRRILLLHTDGRSRKVDQIKANPRVSLVFYDHTRQVQLVVGGKAVLHFDDSVAEAQWAATPASSRRAYLAPLAPGTPVGNAEPNLPASVVGRVPSESELEPARQNFVAISIATQSIDWLRLDHDANIRARFEYGDAISMAWVAP